MLLQSLRPDDNIIEINVAYLTDQRVQGNMHLALMSCGSVLAPLRHYQPHIQPEGDVDSSVGHVVGMYTGLVKRVCHVEFAEELGVPNVTEYVCHFREWVRLRYSVFIEDTIIVHPLRFRCWV